MVSFVSLSHEVDINIFICCIQGGGSFMSQQPMYKEDPTRGEIAAAFYPVRYARQDGSEAVDVVALSGGPSIGNLGEKLLRAIRGKYGDGFLENTRCKASSVFSIIHNS